MTKTHITRYYLLSESDYPTNPIIPVIDSKRNIITTISPESFAAGSLEGSIKLLDGRVINVNSGWVPTTSEITSALTDIANKWYKGHLGYAGLSPSGKYYFTWDLCSSEYGVGMHNKKLIPFKSVASDQSVYRFGTQLRIKELIGMKLPNGEISDGIVSCDDTGSAITGQHLDLMVGIKTWSKINIPDYCDVEVI